MFVTVSHLSNINRQGGSQPEKIPLQKLTLILSSYLYPQIFDKDWSHYTTVSAIAQQESAACRYAERRYAECSGAAECSTAFSKLTLSIMNDSQRNTKKRETQHNHK